jgi:hypothetical protein
MAIGQTLDCHLTFRALDSCVDTWYYRFMNYQYIGHMDYLQAVDHPNKHMSHDMAA